MKNLIIKDIITSRKHERTYIIGSILQGDYIEITFTAKYAYILRIANHKPVNKAVLSIVNGQYVYLDIAKWRHVPMTLCNAVKMVKGF